MVQINISETAAPVTSRIRRAYRESTGRGGDILSNLGANKDTLILASVVGVGLAAGYYLTHYINVNKPLDPIINEILAPIPGTSGPSNAIEAPSSSTTPTNIPPAVVSNAAYKYNTQMADFRDNAVVYNTNMANVEEDAPAGMAMVDENDLSEYEVAELEAAASAGEEDEFPYDYSAYSGYEESPGEYYHYQVVRDSEDNLVGIAPV